MVSPPSLPTVPPSHTTLPSLCRPLLLSSLLLVAVELLQRGFVGSDVTIEHVEALIYHPDLLCYLLQQPVGKGDVRTFR